MCKDIDRKYMKRKRLLASQHDTVLAMFDSGHSMTRIADGLNVSRGSVSKVVRDKYPEMVGRVNLPVKDITKKYLDGDTMDSLADEYGVSNATIKSRLVGAGVELRTQSEYQRIHFFDDAFFKSIDGESKAYWLGFIFADGCVTRNKDVSISLAEKDRGHLLKFQNDIGYSGPGLIKDYTTTHDDFTLAGYKYSRVALRSENMAMDLISHGCIPRKSVDVGPPENIPDEFVIDFIRGVVDGDGYISKQGYPSLELVGAHNLLLWISGVMGMPEPRPHKGIWRVRLSGQRAVEAMETLYKNATVFLDRKHENAVNNFERP